MSIEESINQLTAAVNNLANVVAKSAGAPAAAAPVVAPPTTPAPAAPAPAADPFTGSAAAAPAAPPAGATVEDVRAAIGALASKSHETAVKLLNEHGATKASELTADKYASFVAGAQKALAELAAA